MRHAALTTAALWPLLAAAFLSAAACSQKHAEPAAEKGPVVRVTTFTVTAAADGQALLLPARIEAREEVTVAARIPARVTRLLVAEGESFARGATLVEFAAPETREALAAARSRQDAATMRRDQAVRQEVRLDSLYAARVAALRELEITQAERRAAEAELAAALAALAELESATAVSAPFAGVVVRRHVDQGASVGPGTPLLDIRSREPGSILAMIPESAVPLVATASASFQISDGPFHPAVLERLDGMTDFTTRSRAARFRPTASGLALEPGAFARVRLGTAGPTNALRVPARALVRRGGLVGVFVIRDGKAVLRWIRPGADDGDHLQVLAGLKAGEEIALEPDLLADGRAVEVSR
jgi:RND family efflux transporter MFP subunit